MNCELIFWGNFSHRKNIFKLQKIIIRILMGARSRDYCREPFKILKTLTLISQYIFSLALFVASKKILFKKHYEVNNIKPKNYS